MFDGMNYGCPQFVSPNLPSFAFVACFTAREQVVEVVCSASASGYEVIQSGERKFATLPPPTRSHLTSAVIALVSVPLIDPQSYRICDTFPVNFYKLFLGNNLFFGFFHFYSLTG
jgi:hypothetical protein